MKKIGTGRGMRGKPPMGIYRPITKGEFALLRHLGAKRTHFIGRRPDIDEIGIYFKSREKGDTTYKLSLYSTPDAVKILKRYWGIT